MPFSKTPATSTYQTKSISLINEFDSRDGSTVKDLDFFNCFFETQQSKLSQEKTIHVFKRAGLQNYITLASTNVRGIYYWEDQNRILVATDNDVTIYNSDTGVTIATLSNIFGTTSGDVGFTEFLYDDNSTKIVITDGTTLGTVDVASTWIAGSDPDMPTPHLPQPLFLDGYLFIAKTGTADLYNSTLNDPLAYVAGDFISCEMFPDTVLRIAKLNNYIVAFGSASIEYFWDAGNPTGSPLQRNDTPIKLVGYLGGFAQSGNRIYFVGSTATATPDVYMIEDFKIKPLSNETVRRYLESLTTDLVQNIGSITSFMGHDFYVMNVGNQTYVMDLILESWYKWGYKGNANFTLEQSVSVKSNTSYTSAVFLNGETTLMKFSPSIYQDNGTNFVVRLTTGNEMFETYNQKTMARLIVYGDRTTSTAYLNISWSDDDYQTFSNNVAVNLNQELPSIYRLGRFRRRAFKLEFVSNHPLRLIKLDVDINIGQN